MDEDLTVSPESWDHRAEEYANSIPGSPVRAQYEWPAVQSLLPAVEGTRVLDAGCGSGAFTAWFAEQGADVVGIDVSPGMIRVARDRHGELVAFHQADLSDSLPFDDERFDLVVSQLALDHLKRWQPVFEEFHRVLAASGHLVFSVNHPFSAYAAIVYKDLDSINAETAAYERIEQYTQSWSGEDGTDEIPFYRRPIGEIVNPLVDAGFALERLLEPDPPTEVTEPEGLNYDIPRFLCVRAEKRSRGR